MLWKKNPLLMCQSGSPINIWSPLLLPLNYARVLSKKKKFPLFCSFCQKILRVFSLPKFLFSCFFINFQLLKTAHLSMVLHQISNMFHCGFSAMKKLPFTATILLCPPKNSDFKNSPFAWNYLQRNSPYATIYSAIHPWRFVNSRPLSPLSYYKIHL